MKINHQITSETHKNVLDQSINSRIQRGSERIRNTINELRMRTEILLDTRSKEAKDQKGQKSTENYQHTQNLPNKGYKSPQNIKTQPKNISLIIHIEEHFIRIKQQRTKLQQFLQSYIHQTQSLPIERIQIIPKFKSITTSQPTHQEDESKQALDQELQRIQLKLNLKYRSRTSALGKVHRNVYLLSFSDQKRTCRDQPSTCRDQPSTCKDQPSTCRDQPSTCKDQPSTCRDQGQQASKSKRHAIKQSHIRNIIDWNEQPIVLIVLNIGSLDKRSNKYQFYQLLLDDFFNAQVPGYKQFRVPSIAVISYFKEIIEEGLLSHEKGQRNFERLCQVQFDLFRAQKKIVFDQTFQFFRQKIFLSYIQKIFLRKTLRQLQKFMKFNKKRTQTLKKRHFNLWSLITSESVLRKIDQQIISQKYCQYRHQKQIKKKAFISWTNFIKNKKN